MEKYQDVLQDKAGNSVINSSITVKLTGTNTAAPLYKDDEATPLPQPISTDSSGRFSFKAANGAYDIYVDGVLRRDGVLLFDKDDLTIPDDLGFPAYMKTLLDDTNKAEASVTLGVQSVIDTLANLKAETNITAGRTVYLAEDGKAGVFVSDRSNLASKVNVDTEGGVYAVFDADASGNSGAWVRMYSGAFHVPWFYDGGGDYSTAVRTAVALSNSEASGYTAESPQAYSSPVVFFPAGLYPLSDTGTNGLNWSNKIYRGEDSIIYDSPIRTVSEALRLGIDCSVEHLQFRGFTNQIVIDNPNNNQDMIWITNCNFVNPSNACITFDNNPQSGVLSITNFLASMQSPVDGKFLDMPNGTKRIDFLYVQNGWIRSNIASGVVNRIYSSEPKFTNLTLIPIGSLTSADAAWFEINEVGGSFGPRAEFNGVHFSGENGGLTTVFWYPEAKDSGDVSTALIMRGGRICTSGERPWVKFWKIPNIIEFTSLGFDGVNGGIEIVDKDDADAGTSGVDITNLTYFAKHGEVHVSDIRLLQSRQNNIGLHAGLGYQLMIAAHYKTVGVPYVDKVDAADVLACGDLGNGTRSTISSSASASNTTDARGVTEFTITASADGGTYGKGWANFFDHAIIGADVSADDVNMTLAVEITYNPVNQTGANLSYDVGGNQGLIPLENGKKIYSIPFVYFNTTNTDSTSLDALRIQISDMTSGDEVVVGRVVILQGFQTTDINSLSAYQDSASAPSDVANTNMDFSKGWIQGDKVYPEGASVVGSGSPEVFICTTEQSATTAWVVSGQQGYRTNAGSPVGAVTPNFIGEELLDTTGNQWYKAYNTTSSDWSAI